MSQDAKLEATVQLSMFMYVGQMHALYPGPHCLIANLACNVA